MNILAKALRFARDPVNNMRSLTVGVTKRERG